MNLLHYTELLHHSKSAAYVISIISAMHLLCQSCTPKQIDLLLLLLPYCISVLLLTSRCKLAPGQYKLHYYLTPQQSLLTKQIKTNLMLCKPLFIVHGRIKAF